MKVVSLFSGVGGLDLGFLMAGHRIVWANDNYREAVETYRNNVGSHIIFGDISQIASEQVPNCDIIIGGFPCQGFSVANWNRTVDDSRNLIYQEMVRVIRDKQPRYFVGENVKGLVSLGKGKALEVILEDFESTGYDVTYEILNAADYGVPQNRLRLIIFGKRKGIRTKVQFPPPPTRCDPESKPEPPMKPWVSVGEALAGIPEPEDAPDIPNHTCSKYKLRFNGYLGHRRIEPNKPAPTITGRGDTRGGVVVLHHPNNHRRMTARELALVQSFPMDFVFSGSRTSAYIQIANAVPPLLGKAIGEIFNGKKRS